MDIKERSLQKHSELHGKIEVISRERIDSAEALSLLYTPGVAAPCLAIAEDEERAYELTRKQNLVAVISDGTAVLGLGDIGPSAAMPVMEGKCALFKEFAGVDAFPLVLDTKDEDELVRTIYLLSKSFGGINLEDIAAPRCFAVERRLKELCDIPVFHDDQHGTAVVVAAALLNALKVLGKHKGKLRLVINGAGAAGIAIAKLLLSMEFGDVVLCDINGIVYEGAEGLTAPQREMAKITNRAGLRGTLCDAVRGADVFVGVSRPGLLTGEMVRSMNEGAIVFAMANPTPEIMPDEALAAGAAVVGTGRSDFKNQINNVLAFPGIFKGALRCRAREITEGMKVAAAYAIAASLPAGELSPERIMPDAFDQQVARNVADAVERAARMEGVSRC